LQGGSAVLCWAVCTPEKVKTQLLALSE